MRLTLDTGRYHYCHVCGRPTRQVCQLCATYDPTSLTRPVCADPQCRAMHEAQHGCSRYQVQPAPKPKVA